MIQAVMAVTDTKLFSNITDYIKLIKRNMEYRATARKTYNELNSLSDVELNDIGISRSDIKAISREVFYTRGRL
jgi:uncharacterized protein YjiS (DUF1127 family)